MKVLFLPQNETFPCPDPQGRNRPCETHHDSASPHSATVLTFSEATVFCSNKRSRPLGFLNHFTSRDLSLGKRETRVSSLHRFEPGPDCCCRSRALWWITNPMFASDGDDYVDLTLKKCECIAGTGATDYSLHSARPFSLNPSRKHGRIFRNRF